MVQSSPWRAPRHIITERLALRCPEARDAKQLRQAILESLARLRPWFNWAVDVEVSDVSAAASVRFARMAFSAGTEFQYFIFVKDEPVLIGVCGLTRVDWVRRVAEVVYWLRTGFEGRGYATEAVGAIVEAALSQGGFQRLEALCDTSNAAGQAVLRRLGFTAKLLLPGHRQHPDSSGWADVIRFARESSSAIA